MLDPKHLPETAGLLTPRQTRPELFGACQVRPLMEGERHAPITPR